MVGFSTMKLCKSKSIVILSCLLCLTAAESVIAQPAQESREESLSRPDFPPRGMREGRPGWGGRRRGRDFQQRREQMRQRLEQARTMAQKLLENPNTPDDIKAKAHRLNELLDKRERLDREIDGKRQEFLRTHQQDIDALRRLQEQGERHRQNLRSAREKMKTENQPLIDEMRRTTREAREVARDIRLEYRGRGGNKQEGQHAPPGRRRMPPSSFPQEGQQAPPGSSQ